MSDKENSIDKSVNVNGDVSGIVNTGDHNTIEQNSPTNQTHSGSGDNVAGDKNVYQAPHTIPKSLTPKSGMKEGFVGRMKEIEEITQRLQSSSSLLLLNGIGGIGKTSLAAYYLATHKERYNYYGFIEVSGGVQEAFVSALAGSLQLDSHDIEASFNEALTKLHALEGKKLLVIDDMRSSESLEMLHSLGSSGYDLLFTSRQKLPKVELYRLSTLNPQDAQKLFLKHYDTNELNKVDRILEYLDYHTLFIELVAKTIETQGYSLDTIIEQFHSGKLAKIEYIDEESGEEATINHNLSQLFTLQGLRPEYIKLLQKIATLPSIEIDEEGLCNVTETTKGKLNFLASRGWLIEGENNYKLHQIIKEFILTNHTPKIETIEPQIEYFYIIIRKSSASDTLNEKLYFLPYYQSIASIFTTLNHQDKISSEFTDRLGMLLDSMGEYDRALVYFQEALRIAKAIGDKRGEGTTLNNISQIYDAQGDYTTALEYLKQSLEIRQAIGNRLGEGTTLNNIGQIYQARGDYTTALEYLKQSLKIQQAIGDRSGEGVTLNNISQIYDAQGDTTTALEYLKQSLEIRQAIGDRLGEGATLNNISQIYDGQGDYTTALEYLKQSLEIQQAIGDKRGEGATLNNISQIYRARGDYSTALEYLKQSLTIRQAIGDSAGLCATLFNIGHIHLANDEVQEALGAWVSVYRIAKPIGLAQALDALEDLANHLGLPDGLNGWKMLAERMEV